MSGTLTVAGMSAGLASGQKIIGPVTMTGLNPIGGITDAALVSGDNTFQVPSGAVAVAIFLGVGGVTATVKLRTNLNVSDGGLEIAPYAALGFAVFPLTPGTTEVILNSSAGVQGVELSFI